MLVGVTGSGKSEMETLAKVRTLAFRVASPPPLLAPNLPTMPVTLQKPTVARAMAVVELARLAMREPIASGSTGHLPSRLLK